jgi:serine/threonine-protein kinase
VQTGHPTTVLAGRYALLEELGRSGTGMAWRAEDRLLGRTVTVKLIHPSLADDDAFASRLAEQTRLVASIAEPGIARLLDSGQEDGVAFLVREHVVGSSARERLVEAGPLPPAEAARIGEAVLDALAPAHEAGVLHLHLGLDDVLLEADGRVRVTDLGIGPAVAATRPPGEALRLLGGAGAAPEQVRGDPPDERADLYAVGGLLFELLTGEAARGRREPRRVRAAVPRALDRVVARALDPDPAERYASAPAFASALRAAADDRARPRASRRRWVGAWLGVPLAIVAVAVAVIVAGLVIGPLEVGGPLGIRPAEEPAATPEPAVATAPRPLVPVAVTVLDPFGDGGENDDAAPFTLDGDVTTAWRSENYFDDTLNNKPGVGLLFDLGQARDLAGFRLSAPHPGYEFHLAVGDDPDALVDEIGASIVAETETVGELLGSGRYVLVWITSVVPTPDGNRAEIAEFSVTLDA